MTEIRNFEEEQNPNNAMFYLKKQKKIKENSHYRDFSVRTRRKRKKKCRFGGEH